MLQKVLFVVFAFSGTMIAQLDSSTLRTKFGPPLERETFRLAEGFDLIVDYGPHHQVCRAEVPAQMPADPAAKVTNTEVQARKMDAFLADLFPAAMRGREIGRSTMAAGAYFRTSTVYEKLTIHRTDDRLVVQFKDAACSLNP